MILSEEKSYMMQMKNNQVLYENRIQNIKLKS